MNSEYYMRMALDLAKKGMGYTSPNPMVGAVIVKNGKVIGKGYHHKYGDLHGERDALANATDDVTGATMYVTLEPCCHKGKQPPCVDAIIQAGITTVVYGEDKYPDSVSVRASKRMFDAAKVRYYPYHRTGRHIELEL